MLTRRIALLSTLAASACASANTGESLDGQFRNAETQSDSVHSGVSSEDGQRRLTVRLCEYPERGLAWVWIHARTPDGFFSYVDHMAPAREISTAVSGRIYRDDARTLEIVRRGDTEAPTSATITGACMARKSATSAFGQDEHRMEVSITFSPERLYSGLNKGRTEVFGRSKATVIINGKRTEIEGPAQFHEQGQVNPRFTAPFCYMTLWGTGAATTMLIATKRREGYLLEGDGSTEVASVTVDPPAPWRKLKVMLADGRSLEGEARVVQAYTIPIVGNTWRGHMVNVELGGRNYHGHINDYIIDNGVPYLG
jgi:hypothetical protein